MFQYSAVFHLVYNFIIIAMHAELVYTIFSTLKCQSKGAHAIKLIIHEPQSLLKYFKNVYKYNKYV